MIEKWVKPLQDIIDKQDNQQWFYLNHNDWHYQNTFVNYNNDDDDLDKCQIIAILDWEWSEISFFPMDPIFIKDVEDDWQISQDIIDEYSVKYMNHPLFNKMEVDIEILRNVVRGSKEMVFYTVTQFRAEIDILNNNNALYDKIKKYKLEGFQYLKQMLIKLDCWSVWY